MATVTANTATVSKDVVLITWSGLTGTADVGNAEQLARFNDKTVTATGTFGGTVTMQGSNDGSNWFTLTDQNAQSLTFTSAGGGLIAENPRYVRPAVTAGTITSVTIIICAKG